MLSPENLSKTLDMLQALWHEVTTRQGRLQQERAQYRDRRAMVDALNAQQEGSVLLDVGGEHFRTLKETLMDGGPGSMLDVLVGGPFAADVEEDGSFFLDRDPSQFPAVLAYLRDEGGLQVPEDRLRRQALLREAGFYGLDKLTRSIRQFRPAPTPRRMVFTHFDGVRYSVTGDGTVLVKASHQGSRMAVCHPPMASGRHIWRMSTTTTLVGLGIVTVDRPEGIQPGCDSTSYILYGQPNELWHANQPALYGCVLNPRDVVEAELDLEEAGGRLSFAVNGAPQGVAFQRLAGRGPFYAAVYIYSKVGHSCTLLSYCATAGE